MNAPAKLHPTDRILRAFGLGKLTAAASESVREHVEGCSDCCRRVGEVTNDTFLDRLRGCKIQLPSLLPMVSSLTRPRGQTTVSRGSERPLDSALPPGLAGHPDYDVIRELGRGGMGVVYLVHNRLMRREEVLKVVASDRIDRRGALDRFLTEIGNAGRLHHPNIVTAYSALRLGENLALAMEYVDGLDLSRMVKARGPLRVAHACNYIYQAALGLEHAHDRGMVHRDIKPSNLMLSRHGNRALVKVLDFGLAKVKSEDMVPSDLTHEGQMLGTPGYIAPEQIASARSADIRADVYSLGCTLYYLLTGAPPFQADSLYDLLQAHQSMDALPLHQARPDVPVAVAAIAAKMLAKEPARRFQTPGAVAQALKPFFKSGIAEVGGQAARVSHAGRAQAQAATPPPLPITPPAPSTAEIPPPLPSAASRAWETFTKVMENASADLLAPTDADRALRRPLRLWLAAAGPGILVALVMVYAAWIFRANESPRELSPAGASDRVPLTKSDSRPPGVASSDRPSRLIGNSIGMELALIPAGEFMMGSTPEQVEKLAASFRQFKFKKEQAAPEHPAHRVRITRSFYLGAHEVTRGQFAEFVRATSYETEPERDGKGGNGFDLKTKRYEPGQKYTWRYSGFPQNDRHPVVNVTWNDAAAFCEWLSQKEGKIYRLPTEAEWEFACRGDAETLFYTGDDPNDLVAVANLAGQADGFRFTAPVGSFEPNRLGLFDMHGNVSEWCADWFGRDYYAHSPAIDPTGPSRGSQRVTRGQAWQCGGPAVRSAYRDPWEPAARGMSVGFRVVLEINAESRGLARNARDSRPARTAETPAEDVAESAGD